MALRDSLFKSYLGTFIWDSWSHADTRTQMTTWAMIVHVTFFGSSSDAARRLLHGPAFFLSHSVLAGWLQLTYFNPQIDLRDKLEKWGMTPKVAIPRTLMVHVFTVLAHWLLLVAERTDLRRLHKGMGLKELLARSVVPQVCVRRRGPGASPTHHACLPCAHSSASCSFTVGCTTTSRRRTTSPSRTSGCTTFRRP